MDERYEIKDKIGQGGLGAVYRAIDGQLKREVALKRLLPAGEEGPAEDEVDNLLKEATTLSALQHPNIVTVYDVGTDEKGPFVVMELLKGETFDETVERGALTEKDFRNVVAQTMEALVAAHHEGIVHRDLKPSNLMVNWLPSGKFQIKILDFGLAKFSKKPAVQTIDQTDAILGSIYFMAPEQFERVPLDARTDLYSIGALYYYCLTGEYPFSGDSAPQVMAAHLQNRVEPLAGLRPDLPAWMCDWVMWLVSREMGDRPESAQQALDYFQEERSGAVQPPLAPPSAPVMAPVAPTRAVPPPVPHQHPGVPGGVYQGSPTGTLVGGDPTTMPGMLAPAKRRHPVPVWAMIAIPLLLIALAVVYFTKSGARKIIDERNETVAALNEAEDPRGDAETVDMVMEFIADQPKTDVGTRNVVGALDTLARLQGAGVEDAIMSKLPESPPKIRAGLIGVIVRRGVESALPELLGYIGDPDGEVSDIAIYGVGALGGKKNVDRLIRELENPASEALGDALAGSIITILQKTPDHDARGGQVVAALKAAPVGEFRNRLLEILGHLGGDDSWAELKSVLESTNQDARKAALRGLNSWPDGRPAETVFKLARGEEDAVIKGHALRTYTLLLSAPSDVPDEDKAVRIGELLGEKEVSRSVKRSLIGALARLAVPEAQELADTLATDPAFGGYGENAAGQISRSIDRLQVAGEGELVLAASAAVIEGEGEFVFASSSNAVVGWTSPHYYMMWPIKFDAAGTYEVVVTSATPQGGGGEYEITLAGSRLLAKTREGGGFADVPVGSVEIKKPGTYRLTVAGVELDPPEGELMNLKRVTLKPR